MPAKDQVRALIQESAASGLSRTQLCGVALWDTKKDARLIALKSFGDAAHAILHIPQFIARFGADGVTRATLQCVYEYFRRIDGVQYEDSAFNSLWDDFSGEIGNPEWMTRGIANVRYFSSQSLHLDLGDGIVIRGRSFNELSKLGFSQAILDRIGDDWSGFGASSFVIVTEDSVLKRPDNLILLDAATVWAKAARAIRACRLAGAGDISIGPMWVVRDARFNFGIGGLGQVGASIPVTGSQYTWSTDIALEYPSIYAQLAHLERNGYGASPGNLDIALRSFMGTYDRWPNSQDSQLVDTTTALEALLGSESEIAFKLSFRVSGLLASSDTERAQMLKTMKDFYDTRSKLVHGADLKEKHRQCLEKVDELRALVRRLLRSFLAFAVNPPGAYTKNFFREQLDAALVDATEREKVRAALGL